MAEPKQVTFWRWFFGVGVKPAGYRRFLDYWLLFHMVVAVFLSIYVPVNLKDAANSVLLPLVGILVGLTFAWAGNAQALLQTSEIHRLSEHHPGGYREYVYVYQTAILTVLLSAALWGLAGLGLFDLPCKMLCTAYSYESAKFMLFFVSSVSLRECWHVVMLAQLLLLAQREIKKREDP